MKKIIKIPALVGIYLILALSLGRVVYAAATVETGTLYQTIGAGVDTIEITDMHHAPIGYQTSQFDSDEFWNHTTEYIQWQIQSGAKTAYIKLQSAALADTPDQGYDDLTLLFAWAGDEPYHVTSQNISGCDDEAGEWTEPNPSGFVDMYGSEITLWQARNCTNLGGKWKGFPHTRIRIPANTPPAQYAGLMTATLSTE
jgi:hypothetical protein